MSGTTDGTQRITIISKKSAVNDRANICPFIRLGELSGMVFSDYVKNGLRTEDRNDQLALGSRSSTRALPTRTGGRLPNRDYQQPNRMARERDARLASTATRYASRLARSVSRMMRCAKNLPSKRPDPSLPPLHCLKMRRDFLRQALRIGTSKNLSTHSLQFHPPSRSACAVGMAGWFLFRPDSSRPKDATAG